MSRDIILVIAADYDVHADVVLKLCEEQGATVIRLDTSEFWPEGSDVYWSISNTSEDASFHWLGRNIDLNRVAAIFCRDFVFPKIEEHLDVDQHLTLFEKRSCLNGYLKCLRDRYWMNPPWFDDLSDNKIYQLHEARKLNIQVPPTLVTNNVEAFRVFYKKHDGNVIVKQLSEVCLIDDKETQQAQEGLDAEVYGFYTSLIGDEHLQHIEQIRNTPCLFQKNIHKKADIRVTVVEDHIFPALIRSQEHESSRIDFRHRIDLGLEHFDFPEVESQKLLKLLSNWGIKFAACDYVLDKDDQLIFLEANVSGNWLWIEDALNLKISAKISSILGSHLTS